MSLRARTSDFTLYAEHEDTAFNADVDCHSHSIPRSVKDALSGEEWEAWRDAIRAENETMMEVFEVVERTDGMKVLPGMIVFTKKKNDDGTLNYKARYVVRGDLQVAGRDFDETFAAAGDFTGYRLDQMCLSQIHDSQR